MRRLVEGKFVLDGRVFDPNTGYTCIVYTRRVKNDAIKCEERSVEAEQNPCDIHRFQTNSVIITLRNDKSTFVYFIYKPDCSFFFSF